MSPLEFTRLACRASRSCSGAADLGSPAQLIVLVAALPFNATLWYFGTNELMGHLPIYATLLAVLMLRLSPQFRPAVSALLPAYWRTSEPARPLKVVQAGDIDGRPDRLDGGHDPRSGPRGRRCSRRRPR